MNLSQKNITTGSFDAGTAFLDFLEWTDQKEAHALIIEELYKNLSGALNTQAPFYFVDLACGDGRPALESLKKISPLFSSKMHYIGFDIDTRFVKIAQENTTCAKIDNLESIQVSKTDLFKNKLSLRLARKNNILATVSHVLYYAGDKMPQFSKNIANLLGHGDNLCVLTHNAKDCELASIRACYARGIIARPSEDFRRAAQSNHLIVKSITSTSRLYFPNLKRKEWRILKSPQNWNDTPLSSKDRITTALSLASFIAQQALPFPSNTELTEEQRQMPRLRKEEYKDVVDQIQSLAERKGEPYIKIRSDYQIASPRKPQSQKFTPMIAKALRLTAKEIRMIEEKTAIAYKKPNL